MAAQPLPQAQTMRQTITRSIIVEVGHGQSPIWRTLRRLPLVDQAYVGLDIDAKSWPSEQAPYYDLEKGRRNILARAAQGHDCRFMRIGFNGTLPLPSSAASEVYLSLVANDPRILGHVVERLLRECGRILASRGHLVIDNGAVMFIDSGDIIVRGEPPRILYKTSLSGQLVVEDYANAVTLFLNDSFVPMDSRLYHQFLRDRGLPGHFQAWPGGSFSILRKK